MNWQWVIAVGSPFDALALYGPFAEQEDAIAFGEQQADTWWLVRLEPTS